ncbi:DUF1786 domain-containing protein [uncultured Desulfovibrio sp.]|uniref:DUF1786 domain-containing protein n=1 Tax=uncultured Desulfovibrio sp. TaxID=167968 RepID=UPI00262426FD|nr:DUF1786 domain-containing protein [uncultured Desulfovibrio sp.]
MNELVRHFLKRNGPVLCVDIGSGTQDALLARPGLELHNWPRFVLPSPARLAAQRIRELTLLKCNVWLYGGNIGGGCTQAVREHLAAGLSVASTTAASRGLHDAVEVVEGMGVQLREQCPEGYVPLFLTDYSPEFWSSLLRHACLPQPHMVVAAAQDHGVHPDGNRHGRMQAWTALLGADNDPAHWIYDGDIPGPLTRLQALREKTGGPVSDTGTSALLGALSVQEVRDRSYRDGITLINVGNSHTVAALVYQGRIRGIYEHHTGMRTQEETLRDLEQFRKSWLPCEEVQATGGHGTAFGPYCEEAGGYDATYIMGPRRELLRGQGRFLDPFGDMMMGGCFGLLWGLAQHNSK